MKVVEWSVRSKTGVLADCEDACVVSPRHAAVIDGATAKTPFRHGGITPGQVAVEQLEAAIADLPPTLGDAGAISFLTDRLHAFYRAHGLLERMRRAPADRPKAAVAIYSVRHRQVWLVGDCQCRIGSRTYQGPRQIDDLLAGARALYLQTELARGKTVDELREHDPGRAFIHPLLERQSALQNAEPGTPFAFGAVDGFPVPSAFVTIIRVPSDVREIVLATDGYPVVARTLASSEKRLARLLQQDPLCIGALRSTKGLRPGHQSFDDRAYLRLRIGTAAPA